MNRQYIHHCKCYFLQHDEQLHYCKNIRYLLNTHLPPKWVEYSGSVEYTPQSCPNRTGLIFRVSTLKTACMVRSYYHWRAWGIRLYSCMVTSLEQRLQMHQSVFCARNDANCKSKIWASHSTVSSGVQSSFILWMVPNVSKKCSTSLDCLNLDYNCTMFLQNTRNHSSNDTASYP